MWDSEEPRARGSMAATLSPREQQVLVLAAQGYTDQAISNKLDITLATIGTYWGRIRTKFGPYNRTELVATYLKEEGSREVQALKEQNATLVAELQKHTQSQSGLELMRILVESAPDALLIVTVDGHIEYANDEAGRLFGYSKLALKGLMIELLVPDDLRKPHLGNRTEYMEHPVKRKMNPHEPTYGVRKDGSQVPVAVALSCVKTNDGEMVACFVRELTDTFVMPTAEALAADKS